VANRRSGLRASAAEHTVEHVVAREAARVITVIPPWLAWLAALGLALGLRKDWPGPLAGATVGAASAGLALLALHLTHHRKTTLARYMAALTFLSAGAWLGWTVAAGFGWQAASGRMWLFGGGTLAMAWSVWLHVHDGDDGHIGPNWFHQATTRADAPMQLRVTDVKLNKITGLVRHRGVTSKTAADIMPEVESNAGIPPGSIKLTPHAADAGMSHVAIVNPATLAKPALYRGPSAPGASIAVPIEVGTNADGTRRRLIIVNHHSQVMGMTGAAKTTGYGYCELGETITRTDAGVVAIDLAKGEQFLGCMRPALHELATSKADARDLLWRVVASVRPRTDYLAAMGLTKWEEGCGLLHMTCWVEEASWAFKQALNETDIDKWFVPGVVAARSAGWRFVFSIQRADFTMMPTVIRAQMSRITGGVAGSEDAQFGLTDYQADHGADPARWTSEKPGMFYGDAPGTEETYKLMEFRTDFWGPSSALMAAHAAKYPAGERPYDQWTAAHMNPPPAQVAPPAASRETGAAAAPREKITMTSSKPPPAGDDADEAEPTGYDDPELWHRDHAEEQPIDPQDMEPGEGEWQFGQRPAAVERLPLSPDAAREALARFITRLRREGRDELTMSDLADLCTEIGRSRTWPYDALRGYVEDGVLEELDRPRRWRILREAAA
jgi:hypothetical protein